MSKNTAETLRDAYDLACPKCGQADELNVEITCMAHVTPDSTDPYGDHEWGKASFCSCAQCGHTGTIENFGTTHALAQKPTSRRTQHDYLFDAKLFASLRVTASSEAKARRILTELLDCATVNCGALPDGSPLTGDASLDGELDLVEVDGEPPS